MSSGPKKIFEYKEDINGKVPVLFSWSIDQNYVACGGDKSIVYILDKRGKKLKDITLANNNKLIGLEWDKDSELLVIVQEGLNFVSIWQVFGSNQITKLDLESQKEKTCWAKWSRSHGILAVASDKGAILFYTKKQSKRMATVGKHSKKVISGDWNNEGYLITSGEDRLLTVSNQNSETVYESIPVKAEARNILWSRSKSDNRDSQQRTVTAVIQQKAIIMFELGRNHKLPDELVFENKYGKIVDYQIFGDGYIVVGFTEGYVAHISTHRKEIKDEVQSEKIFNSIDAICTNDQLYKLAVAGEGKVKMINLQTWQENKTELIELPQNCGRVSKMQWSQNGQTLIISTEKGLLFGYLTSMPTLTATVGNLLAVQQSFTEISIAETSKQQFLLVCSVNLENEPTQLALSQQYLASALNNTVSYYKWLDKAANKVLKGGQLVAKKDYMGFVQQIFVNDKFSAVLADGKCTLQQLEDPFEQSFPSTEQERPIQHIGLTRHFLFLLDSQSKIRVFNLNDKSFIIEYRNDFQFQRIFPNISGTRCVLISSKGEGYLFEASIEQATKIRQFPEKTERVLWDQKDPNLFMTMEAVLTTFLINKNILSGDIVFAVPEMLAPEHLLKPEEISQTEIDKGMKVLSLSNGSIKYLTPQGTVYDRALASHSYLDAYKGAEDDQEGHFRYVLQNAALCKFANSFNAAVYLKNLKLFDTLGRKCLEYLDFEVAQKAFQKSNNISMVMMIQSFKNETEKNLLFAYVAMILGQHDLAQDFFLKSSNRMGALDLRCDIQDYANALTLAKQIAPEQEPYICKRLAIQIETQGNNPEALKMYERAQLNPKAADAKTLRVHNMSCLAGISRCSIKMGDILRGTSLVRDIDDPQILQEIALVCENMKQYIEAAEIYEQAGVLEKAASLYIQQKMFKQAAPLMNKIRSPKLLCLYAKAKESEGQYLEAESAYEKAEEWESVVRLNLSNLDNIEKAKFILRNKCQTSSVAQMVATYCERRGSKSEAVEFLIMAGKKEEAFALAQSHSEMDSYADHMKAFSLEERLRVAQYYEGKSQLEKAAFHYEKAQDPLKALRLYQQAGEDSIPEMIELVTRNRAENLIQNLLDYLTGETDDIPKEPQWAYKLYKAIGNVSAASKIAITIASQEQEQGKYKDAHIMLYETCEDMRSTTQIPGDLMNKLMILHSYIILKRIVKLEEHEDAARLLDRICKNISQFPSHAPNILTTAVIEATRANFKSLAFQWAAVLMKPEYRSQINDKFKKQIENIARKPAKDEIQETKTPCPFCGEFVPEFQLDCPKCTNMIPFCIASGKHIVADQCTLCPECKFPANIAYLKRLLEQEPACPLCLKDIRIQDLKEISREDVLKMKRRNVEIKS